MRWHDLLFIHWRIEPHQAARVLPRGLEPDLFDGSAWVGLVPFTMTRVRPLGIGLPTAQAFHECNVRTYVRHGGDAGVYFLSLDAASALAVCAAKWIYRLPYHRAHIEMSRADGEIDFRARRCGRDGPITRMAWETAGELPPSAPGSLEWFLTERYCLFLEDERRGMGRGRIWHPRWRLRRARLMEMEDELVAAAGFVVSGAPQSVLASDGTVASAWPPRRCTDLPQISQVRSSCNSPAAHAESAV